MRLSLIGTQIKPLHVAASDPFVLSAATTISAMMVQCICGRASNSCLDCFSWTFREYTVQLFFISQYLKVVKFVIEGCVTSRRNNKIHDAGVNWIAVSLTHLPYLQKLDLA